MAKISRKRHSNMKNKTRRHRSLHGRQNIVYMFMSMLNAVKLYHWKTHSYSTHEATDELYSKLNEHIDEFVEVMLGKIGKRGNILNIPTMKLKQINNNHDLKREIGIYKKFLIDMDHDKSLGLEGNSDLMNIRDEILASMNRFLYLLTLH